LRRGKIGEITLLHSDDDFVAVNKPAGVSTVSERWDPEKKCLIDLVWDLWKSDDPEAPRPHVVHRLDKETTGVILFARHGEAQAELRKQFMERTTQKTYHTLVEGLPEPTQGEITFHVEEHPGKPGSMRICRQGKECQSAFELLRAYDHHSWVEVRPRTGRTHQVRLTMAQLGSPCCSDPVYGSGSPLLLSSYKRTYRPGRGEAERPLLSRLGLHAHKLQVRHPRTGESTQIEAPLPKDLRASLRQLDRWSRQ
jgi:23S rRNA pseudouridine1911/1915/1917 synthase